MIREERSREKLALYYETYKNLGVMDANVHPWVQEAWQESQRLNIPRDTPLQRTQVVKIEPQGRDARALSFLADLASRAQPFLEAAGATLSLLDAQGVILKCFALPFRRMPDGEAEGVCLAMASIGASSVSVAMQKQVAFWMYGPEMWLIGSHNTDAATAPVHLRGEAVYYLNLTMEVPTKMPQEAVMGFLLSAQCGMEAFLAKDETLRAGEALMDAAPFALYHILDDGTVSYANRMGKNRLAAIDAQEGQSLAKVILNLWQTPIGDGLAGKATYNQEITWVTKKQAYEDITTVIPFAQEGEKRGIVAVSMPMEDLRALVRDAAGYTAKYDLSSLAGESVASHQMRDKALRIAHNGRHTLLQGEAGTGKERIAHGIHRASTRHEGPFIRLSAGDVEPEFFAAELFGECLPSGLSRQGKLELAAGGTLFLDEIEKIPLAVGHMLAEALHAGKAKRVGETVERKIDARMIAATDTDLKSAVTRGLFDALLYETISRNVLRVPALRHRREDIPALLQAIVRELCRQKNIPVKTFSQEAMSLLVTYDWPGNIKQLQDVVESAVEHVDGKMIQEDDIHPLGDNTPDNRWKEDREVFLQAFLAAGKNISRLANLLGVSRVTLYRYLKKHGLERAENMR